MSNGTTNTGSSRTGRRVYRRRRKVCEFCSNKEKQIDWKDTDTLKRYVGEGGQILSRRKTGACAKHQRRVTVAIKRARHMALLPFTIEHVRLMGRN
ncbi:MAG: 30S ribosomal protein S18 [Chloroflexi bacterium]|nr:MAG: 30S ribosomal protein S18 [Chloroflexota bacterium]